MLRVLIVGACAMLVAAASATVAFTAGGPEDTVSATVSVQAISVSVDPTSIDYGTLPFETTQRSDLLPTPITFTATNDGNVNEDFSLRGTDATGTGFTWTLVQGTTSCGPSTSLNKFRHRVTPSAIGAFDLSTVDTTIATALAPLGAGSTSFTTEFYMPCTGSDGVGLTASTSIVVTATQS
jgi:hypothetical protein